jgi:hypothetical protein
MKEKTDIRPIGTPEWVVLGSELMARNIEKIQMLYDGLILSAGTWAIVGASDTCKSMILRQLAMCVAGGREFLGRAFNGKHRSVIIVCTEDDDQSTTVFLKMQNKTLQLSVEEQGRIRLIFDTTDLRAKLEEELKRCPTDLIIIDAFADLYSGDLNQNNQVRNFMNDFDTLAKNHKCSLCFLHHTGKRTEELVPSKNNSIGSQGFEAKARAVMELRKDASDESLRHLCIVKGNYFPDDIKTSSMVLKKDENCVFTDTGQRKPFEELALKKEVGDSSGRQTKSPYDIDDETHIGFLQDIFHTKGATFSFTALRERIMRRFGVGDQKAREYILVYADRKWITDKSTVKSRKQFHINESAITPQLF